MLRPINYSEEEKLWYGLGFWFDKEIDAPILEGYDAGVSFKSGVSRKHNFRYTVISNTSSGVWPIVEKIISLLVTG